MNFKLYDDFRGTSTQTAEMDIFFGDVLLFSVSASARQPGSSGCKLVGPRGAPVSTGSGENYTFGAASETNRSLAGG